MVSVSVGVGVAVAVAFSISIRVRVGLKVRFVVRYRVSGNACALNPDPNPDPHPDPSPDLTFDRLQHVARRQAITTSKVPRSVFKLPRP